jgi:hypothetical protein
MNEDEGACGSAGCLHPATISLVHFRAGLIVLRRSSCTALICSFGSFCVHHSRDTIPLSRADEPLLAQVLVADACVAVLCVESSRQTLACLGVETGEPPDDLLGRHNRCLHF